MRLALALVLAGCGGAAAVPDLGARDLAVGERTITADDRDGDGLADAEEARLAAAYLPFLSLAADDPCPTSGIVYRATPLALAPLVALRYAWLFDEECGARTRAGAGGGFTVVVDPRRAAPDGDVALRALAWGGSACQRISTCGRCLGQSPCATLGGVPAVWAARGAHAVYVDRPSSCTQIGACAADCVDATAPAMPAMVNVGEPEVGLVRDLTTDGFIRPELGWKSPELLHYDPFGQAPFGASPAIATMLDGPSGDPPVCVTP